MNYFDYLPPGYGPTATRSVTFVSTLPARLTFYTWREAVLTAVEASKRHGTKATVRKIAGRWVLEYRYTPVLINGGAA